MVRSLIVIGVVLVTLSLDQNANAVTLNQTPEINSLTLQVRDRPSHGAQSNLFPSSLPFADSHALSEGEAFSSASYSLSKQEFYVAFDQARPGGQEDFARSRVYLHFTVAGDATYGLEGIYSALDASGRSLIQDAYILDLTTGVFLFRGTQHTDETPNESFTLGLKEGDQYNLLVGSLAGTLVAGHDYVFYYDAWIETDTPLSTAYATAKAISV